MNVKLIVESSEQQHREIPLPRKIFLIGRDAKCNLRPKSSQVSRRHCAIAIWAGKVSVRDLKSTNGTFLNDQRIHGEVKVTDGDRLKVGNLILAFRFQDAQSEEYAESSLHEDLEWLMGPAADQGDEDAARKTAEICSPP